MPLRYSNKEYHEYVERGNKTCAKMFCDKPKDDPVHQKPKDDKSKV